MRMIKTTEEYINQAILNCRGDVQTGDVVATECHRYAMTLIGIVGDTGIMQHVDGKEETAYLPEIFDVNKVKQEALRLLFLDSLKPTWFTWRWRMAKVVLIRVKRLTRSVRGIKV